MAVFMEKYSLRIITTFTLTLKQITLDINNSIIVYMKKNFFWL